MAIPKNQIEFFLLPAPLTAIIIGSVILALTVSLLAFPKIRPYFKPLLRLYYILVMIPLYLAAGIVYCITLSKVNIFQKFKEVDFHKKFKRLYSEPNEFFEDMRVNPQNYHLWVGVYICAVFITLDYLLIVLLTEMFYNGQETIIFGIISSEPPVIKDSLKRWIYMAIIGIIVWIPTKFTIQYLALAFHKYDKSDEPQDRPWYDKARLTYIAWGYIIAADSIWCLGMILSLIFALVFHSWEVLIFTWIFIMTCGIIEMTYQQYSLHGIYKLGWIKGYIIWLMSMIPFIITSYLLVNVLGRYIN